MLNELKIGDSSVYGEQIIGETELHDKNSGFKAKVGEEVRLLNRLNKALPVKVIAIMGDFIILSTDKSRSSISFIQKLKLYWNLFK